MVLDRNSPTWANQASNGETGSGRRRRRLGREDWLSRALVSLEAHGVEGVRIVPLARDLGVTSGSFYWHFRNRRELLSALLLYWDEWSTLRAIEHMETQKGKPQERLMRLLEFVLDEGLGDYDAAMQAWAVHDPEAAAMVARVFGRRMDYVSGLFREMGHPGTEARTRALLVASLMTFVYSPGAALPPESRRELVRLAHENLTS
jgi:AcrR family transcriptional regulator